MECRGKQDLWTRQKPELLSTLRELAIIRSTESSNRIEGVTVDSDRLRPLVVGKARPKDRCEEEIVGYRRALNWILSRKVPVTVDSELILRLHSMAQGGMIGDAGQWKSRDNEIVEILPDGNKVVRFKPLGAAETPHGVRDLCRNYRQISQTPSVPTLLTVSTFVFDFLCIHPFRDGNGRVSRLLTALLLVQNGFEVGRYVSLERLIEEGKEDYYRVLSECSRGWHTGENEIVPWWNYFLTVVHRAYREFEDQVASTGARPTKSELIRQTVLGQLGPFTLAEINAQFPAASVQLVKKVLGAMKDEGILKLSGRGRGARWEVVRGT